MKLNPPCAVIVILLPARVCYYKTTSIFKKNTEQKKNNIQIYRPRFSNNMLTLLFSPNLATPLLLSYGNTLNFCSCLYFISVTKKNCCNCQICSLRLWHFRGWISCLVCAWIENWHRQLRVFVRPASILTPFNFRCLASSSIFKSCGVCVSDIILFKRRLLSVFSCFHCWRCEEKQNN